MFRPNVPANIRIHQYEFENPEDIPEGIFERIRAGFVAQQQSEAPLVSVNIIAWNEESNILRNLSSLSAMKSACAVEYIYVDNNSSDKTSEIIRKCGITPVPETKQGYGFARQAALENSHGTYILTGDADTIYPPTWVDTMLKPILSGKSIASSGTYSFTPGKGQSRLRYAVYEFFRDIIHALRTVNRPYLAVGGVNFCFPRQEALKIGFIKNNSRSEDGSMALALLKTGKIKRVTKLKAAAWTITRSVENSGTFFKAIKQRVIKEFKRVSIYFYKHK
jgi:glycosyltransferase involved in cell wall biosynthesis